MDVDCDHDIRLLQLPSTLVKLLHIFMAGKSYQSCPLQYPFLPQELGMMKAADFEIVLLKQAGNTHPRPCFTSGESKAQTGKDPANL